MSGIYIHVPFCKQACHYCDFHFSTNLQLKDDLVDCLKSEITLRSDYLKNSPIETIYFGGGTPSILETSALKGIIDHIRENHVVSTTPEITCECNPDDLTDGKTAELASIGINRLSIGIQSFNDKTLQSFNRAHDATLALSCVEKARNEGIENISIDLIFGAPNQSMSDLKFDLEKIKELDVPHVSIYGMTIEENTAFGKWYQKGQLKPLEDEQAAQQFEVIMNTLSELGYVQYEISNFAKVGFESKHNSSYWQSKPYIGIGPSAHSFDGQKLREHNISNNPKYIRSIQSGRIPTEKENLTIEDRINERILIQLRTIQGLDLEKLKRDYNDDLINRRKAEVNWLEDKELLKNVNNTLVLTHKGKLLADSIIEKLIL